MQRDMSYDLDGVFATRNQGQLINQQKVQTSVVRAPGLVEMRPATAGSPLPGVFGDMLAGDVTVPGIGVVPKTAVVLGIVGLGAAFFMSRKTKKSRRA